MPSYKPKVQILLSEDYHKKFKALCEKERRSDSVMGAIMIEKFINEYEAEHGEIKVKQNPTMKEAIEAQKTTIKEIRENPISKTLKDSWKNGSDLGIAAADKTLKK